MKSYRGLEKIDFSKYYPSEQAELVKGNVKIQFFDELNNSPDPSTSQMNTVRFIEKNQDLLIDRIYKRVTEVEYPFMKKQINVTDYWFPEIDSINDITKVLGMKSIQILTESKDDFCYFLINCDASYEEEHGVHFLFYKDEILDVGNAWEFNLKLICEHCGYDYDLHIKEQNSFDKEIFNLIEPHGKYEKLKPWQLKANAGLPYRLISASLLLPHYSFSIQNTLTKKKYCLPIAPQE
ncbi:MAG: hypothetical protein AAGG68_07305 [Bacteroidota bacterium]